MGRSALQRAPYPQGTLPAAIAESLAASKIPKSSHSPADQTLLAPTLHRTGRWRARPRLSLIERVPDTTQRDDQLRKYSTLAPLTLIAIPRAAEKPGGT